MFITRVTTFKTTCCRFTYPIAYSPGHATLSLPISAITTPAMVLIPTTCSAVPLSPLPTRTFLVSEITRAAKRVAEVAQKHPSWPQSRVRATVARELNVSTVQLRYLLAKAADAN